MHRKPTINITVPVYNEEIELEGNIRKLLVFCLAHLEGYDFTITIADNASTDQTPKLGRKLAEQEEKIRYIRFPEKGRGRAVKANWKNSKADVCCYMDIDLSTNLRHLPKLVAMLLSGKYDIGIGSRLLRGSKVIERSTKREFISRVYNLLVKIFFQTKFSDAQCGFKAITRKAADELLPFIEDNKWFMDSELLIIAEKLGYKIYEEPVEWHDNPGSTVRVLPTALEDLEGLLRLFRTRPWEKIRSHDRHS